MVLGRAWLLLRGVKATMGDREARHAPPSEFLGGIDLKQKCSSAWPNCPPLGSCGSFAKIGPAQSRRSVCHNTLQDLRQGTNQDDSLPRLTASFDSIVHYAPWYKHPFSQ